MAKRHHSLATYHRRRNPSMLNTLLKSDVFTLGIVGVGGYYVYRNWNSIKAKLFPPKV